MQKEILNNLDFFFFCFGGAEREKEGAPSCFSAPQVLAVDRTEAENGEHHSGLPLGGRNSVTCDLMTAFQGLLWHEDGVSSWSEQWCNSALIWDWSMSAPLVD